MNSFNATVTKLIKEYQKSHDGAYPSRDYLIRTMLLEHHTVVKDWMDKRIRKIVGNGITRVMHAQRTQTSMKAIRGEAEEPEVLNAPFYVPSVGWKTLGTMTGPDHSKVAESYELVSDTAKRRAVLHRLLAEEVGDKTTAEVFTASRLINRLTVAYKPGEIPSRVAS